MISRKNGIQRNCDTKLADPDDLKRCGISVLSILPGLFDYIQKVKLNGKMPGRRHGSIVNIKLFMEERKK